MRGFKKYGIRLLLLLVVSIWLLYPLYYDIAIVLEKYEQHNRIDHTPKEELIELRLTKPVFDDAYSATEQELEIEGHMYDVVRVNVTEKEIVCIVLPDEEESELQHKLVNFLKVKGHGKSSGQVSFSFPIAFYEDHLKAKHVYPNIITTSYKEPEVYSLLGGYKQKIGKPPKCVIV